MKNNLNTQQIGYLTCFFSEANDQLLAEAVNYMLSLDCESINACLGLTDQKVSGPLREEIKKYFRSNDWKRCFQQEVDLYGRYCSEVLHGIHTIKNTRKLEGSLNDNRWNIVKRDVSVMLQDRVEPDDFGSIQDLFILIRGAYQYMLACCNPYCLQFEIRNPGLSLNWFSYGEDLIQEFRLKSPLRQYLTDMQRSFISQAQRRIENPEDMKEIELFLEKMKKGASKTIEKLTNREE